MTDLMEQLDDIHSHLETLPVFSGRRRQHYNTIKETKNKIKTQADEIERLLHLAIVAGLWHSAPCRICGYNGLRYFHPDTHDCVRLDHELQETFRKRLGGSCTCPPLLDQRLRDGKATP